MPSNNDFGSCSTRLIRSEIEISQSSVDTIMRDLLLYPCKIRLLQRITNDDKIIPKQF